jgi:hypothetical protein
MATKQDKRKRAEKRERIQARKQAEQEQQDEVIESCELADTWDRLKGGERIYIAARESEYRQTSNEAQEAFMRTKLAEKGCIVVGAVRHQGTGQDPSWLIGVVKEARQRKADAIVFLAISRQSRPADFHPHRNPQAPYTSRDLKRLRFFDDGFPSVTFASLDKDKSALEKCARWYRDEPKRLRSEVAKLAQFRSGKAG